MRVLWRLLPILLALMLAGCSEQESAPATTAVDHEPEVLSLGYAIADNRAEMRALVDAILQQSTAQSEPAAIEFHGDPRTFQGRVRRPRALPLPADWPPLALAPPVPAEVGRVVLRNSEPPAALLPGDDGGLTYSLGERTIVRAPNGDEVEHPAGKASLLIQPSSSGAQTLSRHPGGTFTITAGTEMREGRADGMPVGWLDEESLLIVKEQIQASASVRDRIILETFRYTIGTGETTALPWRSAGRFAAIGTLPQLGAVWVQRAQPFQIQPLPAPLWSIKDGDLDDTLTRTEDAADMHPTASADGRLAWVRTWRHGSDSARGFIGTAGIVQVTGRPTAHCAISPAGKFTATTVREGDEWVTRLISEEQFHSSTETFAEFQAHREALQALAGEVLADLRAALERQPAGSRQLDSDFGKMLGAPPTVRLVNAMTEALVDSLRERAGMVLTADLDGLARLDQLLDEVGVFLPEEPATVLALGGFTAGALGTAATWELASADQALTLEFEELTWTDNLSFTAALPFGAARARLDESLPLTAFARDLLASAVEPIYLTENVTAQTLDWVRRQELDRAGFAYQGASALELFDYLRRRPNTPTVLDLLGYNTAKGLDVMELRLFTAHRLARRHPATRDALKPFADALYDAYYSEEALDLYGQIVLLNPTDIHDRLAFADALFGLNKLDEASAELDTIVFLDLAAILKEDIAERRDLIGQLQQ